MNQREQKTVVLLGALDTKGPDYLFVRDLIRGRGLRALVVDFGVMGDPPFAPDVAAAEVAEAGGGKLDELRRDADKARAMRVMAAGLKSIVRRLRRQGDLQGALGMGGTGGSSLIAGAMRELPVGVPKLLLSTAAAGDIGAYVGSRDITVAPSVVDVAGLNRISRPIYANAANAISGMVEALREVNDADKPVIAASMFGNTTECVERARTAFEARGYEVLVFHATGAGGRTMRSLIDDGLVSGVFDITTTELADEVCGGVFSAGPERVLLGASHRAPVVLAPGCVDMCNFGAPETVPEKYRARKLYQWNPNVTLLRTNVEENTRIGELLAETANHCAGPVALIWPLGGVSMLDRPGGEFWDEEADRACLETTRRKLRPGIPLIEVDANINASQFADRASDLLLSMF